MALIWFNLNILISVLALFFGRVCATYYEIDEKEDEREFNSEYGEYFEGDMLLNEQQLDMVFGRRNASLDQNYLWPNAAVIYRLSVDYTAEENEWILKAMHEIQNVSCVRFRERTNETAYVQFQAKNDGCYSAVGFQNNSQILNLSKNRCFASGKIIHELLHALGFYHTQSATDRDDYVRINFENIKETYEKNFKKYNASYVSSLGLPYDYASIMHYSEKAFAKRNGLKTIEPLVENDITAGMGQRRKMSKYDVQKLNILYKCIDSSDAAFSRPIRVFSLCIFVFSHLVLNVRRIVFSSVMTAIELSL